MPEDLENMEKPKILISGAGLGGLTLAILLKKAKIPFLIFERAHEVKPLGSALILGPNVMPLFKQMRIYDEFTELGKYAPQMHIVRDDLKSSYVMDNSCAEKLYGCRTYAISRPDLYDLLLRQIPKESLCLGKKVISFLQNKDGVMVRCSDNSTHHGDILVGADGAYSAVRQHLYKLLKEKKKLPTSDATPMPYSCVCLVGQTEVLDVEEFPDLKSEICQFYSVLGVQNMCTWLTVPMKKNTVCWMVIQFLNKEAVKSNDSFRNSEWGTKAAEAMCREVRGFKVPGGKGGKQLILGDYIDRTPKEFISKVMLEEKVFGTWYGGRTVLLGDACHKINPSSGSGALTAMHDAIALANWIATLQSKDFSKVEAIFKEYQAERLPVAKEAYETSQLFTKNLGKSMLSIFVRAFMKRIPSFLWKRLIIKLSASRPQVSFLPLIEDNSEARPLHQPSLHKTLAILKEQARAKSNKDAAPQGEPAVALQSVVTV
ncbi:hypothetical protein BGZ59_006516 [Podila verticillata]|nr:hypothetical protein BGZ59_006516 [Podila verticillata]